MSARIASPLLLRARFVVAMTLLIVTHASGTRDALGAIAEARLEVKVGAEPVASVSLRNVGDTKLIDVNLVVRLGDRTILAVPYAELKVGATASIRPTLFDGGHLGVKPGRYALIVEASFYDEEMRSHGLVEVHAVDRGAVTPHSDVSVGKVALSEFPSVRLTNQTGNPIDVRYELLAVGKGDLARGRRLSLPPHASEEVVFSESRRHAEQGPSKAFVIVEWDTFAGHQALMHPVDLPATERASAAYRELAICSVVGLILFALTCWRELRETARLRGSGGDRKSEH